ncbi:uncharacterized protein [Argopecten irradians]|uniref:uncharacterized protein n=1 Tax=Argopecten irradians TaxID=31199 RepID=UPI0037115D43
MTSQAQMTDKAEQPQAVASERTEGRRIRTLTEKAEAAFTEKVNSFRRQLTLDWESVTQCLEYGTSCDDKHLGEAERNLCLTYGRYRLTSIAYRNYLSLYHTEASIELWDSHCEVESKCDCEVNEVLQSIDGRKQDLLERRSQTSNQSVGSNSSYKALEARVNAEKAKARAEYKRKEAILRKQQAELARQEALAQADSRRKREDLEADLDVMKEERACAEATAEAKVYEDFTTIDKWSTHSVPIGTKAYVESQMNIEKEPPPSQYSLPPVHPHVKVEDPLNYLAPPYIPRTGISDVPSREPDSPLYAPSLPKEPRGTEALVPPMGQEPQMQAANLPYMNFAQFLMKKDLAITRLVSFNDTPDTYISWKASFQSVMVEAGVSASEELDLLVKWLGPTSSSHAISIRATNATNPDRGRQILWQRLDERYGSPEVIEAALRHRVEKFPKLSLKDGKKLYDLLDILTEIQVSKQNPKYATSFAHYDSALGIGQIVPKLPTRLQMKWTDRAAGYKRTHGAMFPPFSFFITFVSEMATVMNDPGLTVDIGEQHNNTTSRRQDPKQKSDIRVRKTEVQTDKTTNGKSCPIHPQSNSHSIDQCKDFKKRSLDEKREYIRQNRLCFRCIGPAHTARNCKEDVKCSECGSRRHLFVLHESRSRPEEQKTTGDPHGGEPPDLNSKCTAVCGTGVSGRSCAKTLLVDVYPEGRPDKAITVYAILDDQSNCTLASPQLLDALDVPCTEICYTLSSCSGKWKSSGRRAVGLTVRSADGSGSVYLPSIIECENIPMDSSEIPTPEIVQKVDHLKPIAKDIPKYRPECFMGLLIGRDLPEAHHVHEQIVCRNKAPFAQKTILGWVVVGEMCLGKMHSPTGTGVKVLKTKITNGRGSLFPPCEQNLYLKYDDLFVKTSDDEKIGWSVEDRKFRDLMERECSRDENGFWVAPLPFRTPRQSMPNNRKMAWKRANILDASLKKNQTKRQHFITFMDKVLTSRAAEVAPSPKGEVWYLPIFGIYNPKKPGKIRGVFDSSAEFEGMSLNGNLLTGPNLTNSLLGILLRFRKDAYAVSGDIEQMFYRFLVAEKDRDYLRFLWYRDNDPDKDIIDYRMRAHVFGNSPSPAVATFALRKAVQNADHEVKEFVTRDFYVDDALTSRSSAEEVVSIVRRTQEVLQRNGNIRLHKIISNSKEVMSAFDLEDRGEGLKAVDIEKDFLPVQRSLGMSWDLHTDQFLFEVQLGDTLGTRRGILSALNSIFDPIGFLSPFTIQGRFLLRELTTGNNWDEPISETSLQTWEDWRASINQLHSFGIGRMFTPISLTSAKGVELHIFSDASTTAIAAVGYVRTIDEETHVGFAMGKAKLAPTQGHTVPRLELCAAVLATDLGVTLSEALAIPKDKVHYYTDSKVVLGYLSNTTRRFYTYVANRVHKVLQISSPDQWAYIPTQQNPADQATRSDMTVDKFRESLWLNGPARLRKIRNESDLTSEPSDQDFPLVTPESDCEIRPDVIRVKKTEVLFTPLVDRSERFSDWQRLVLAVSFLKGRIRAFRVKNEDGVPNTHQENYTDSETFILKELQRKFYASEIKDLSAGKPISRQSDILSLSPFLDDTGILRVGGRLRKSNLSTKEKNPILIPGNHHVAVLLTRHYHDSVQHQGRHFTEGAIRAAGFWITRGKRVVSDVIRLCTKCHKLRGNLCHQKMADLPSDRLTPSPPFSYVGVDVFGPWNITTRRTRGGAAASKRWAVIFTCLSTRAIHIEVIEEMSSSSFINAVRRFYAIRGKVKEFRSDRGTNFVGATNDLDLTAINVEDDSVKRFVGESGAVWKFNPPHASHFGGVWERMIGVARRILDSMLLDNRKSLTNEVLTTLMAEVCAIVNARPLVPVSSDVDNPFILSPSTLLTQKTGSPVESSSLTQLDVKDMYRSHWKHVQVLANQFWNRWKREYLPTLQPKRKWTSETTNLEEGDVVLVKDSQLCRNDWPMGVIERVFPSDDGLVRKVEIMICRDGVKSRFIRPVSEVTVLVKRN